MLNIFTYKYQNDNSVIRQKYLDIFINHLFYIFIKNESSKEKYFKLDGLLVKIFVYFHVSGVNVQDMGSDFILCRSRFNILLL